MWSQHDEQLSICNFRPFPRNNCEKHVFACTCSKHPVRFATPHSAWSQQPSKRNNQHLQYIYIVIVNMMLIIQILHIRLAYIYIYIYMWTVYIYIYILLIACALFACVHHVSYAIFGGLLSHPPLSVSAKGGTNNCSTFASNNTTL